MKNRGIRLLSALCLPVLIFVICALLIPSFGFDSIMTVLSQTVIPAAMGFGMAFPLAAGMFDLSGGSRVMLAAVLGGVFASRFGLAGMIIGSILAGIAGAVLMGLLQSVLKLPSLIASLGLIMLLEVLAAKILGPASFVGIERSYSILGKSPWKYILCLVMAAAFYLIYYHTKFGNHLKAVGDNEVLAGHMGINIRRTVFLAYLIGGVFLGITGILQISYSGSIAASVGMSTLAMIFQPMMGVMIGMELLALVNNLAVTVVIGELCISIIYNAVIAMGVSSTMQQVVLGIFMIIVLSVSANKNDLQKVFRRHFRKEAQS